MLGTNQVLHQGRYRIINSFDQDEWGGMYEAYDTVSDTNVVLRESVGIVGKVATANQIEAINAAFAGEAKVLTEIKHESLVTVHDYFSEIDRQYLVLESVTGINLTKYLDPAEPKPALSDMLSWADQVLNALYYLHRLSPPVIHRDVRPENIKLTASLKVKLLTAKISISSGSDAAAQIPNHGNEGTAVNYKPLEQLWADLDPTSQRVILNSYDEKAAGILLRPLDSRSDIYSAGASFYHVLTGTLPYDALERSIAILDGKPDPLVKPSDLNDNIPPEVSDSLLRAMALRRENRFDSAVIMSQVLRTAVIRAKEREAGLAELSKDDIDAATKPPVPAAAKPVETEGPTPAEIATVEAQLAHEQSLAEERQREIEAEQARLDEEREKLEQRRLELEAEKERQAAERERLKLEAEQARQRAEQERRRLEKEKLGQEAEKERQRIAERLAVLEAEREAARAEEERLEQEAEAERQRAEQRLQDLQAEQERHRAEQKRIEMEAKEELERAEQRILELSGVDLDISEPEDKKPAVAETKTKAAEKVPAFAMSTDEEIPVPEFGGQSGVNWKLPAVGAGALLLIGAAAVWMFMPGNDPAPAPVAQKPAVIEQEVNQPAPDAAPEQDQASSQEPSGASPVAGESNPSAETQKRPQISAVPDKKKPAADKTPAPKKKVTVDDLLNDN
jgi:serine/threonine protein kinase